MSATHTVDLNLERLDSYLQAILAESERPEGSREAIHALASRALMAVRQTKSAVHLCEAADARRNVAAVHPIFERLVAPFRFEA